MKIVSLFVFLFIYFALPAQKSALPFPKFSLLKMDSSSYLTDKDLKMNTNTVFINFSPTCDHCERTIKSILENIEKFRDTQFVLSSFEDFSAIRKFYLENMLNSYANIFIGQERNHELTSQVQYTSFPCAVFYDKKNRWIGKLEGERKAREYLKLLKIK
jgi:thioredoxin-related protein